jgi:hypothetical protein
MTPAPSALINLGRGEISGHVRADGKGVIAREFFYAIRQGEQWKKGNRKERSKTPPYAQSLKDEDCIKKK